MSRDAVVARARGSEMEQKDSKMTFESWMVELKRVAVEEFGYSRPEDFDPDYWKEQYEEGMSPFEALSEDCSYA
jgi:hypothetical protein